MVSINANAKNKTSNDYEKRDKRNIRADTSRKI